MLIKNGINELGYICMMEYNIEMKINGSATTWTNMDESHKYNVEWRKGDQRVYTAWFYLYKEQK